MQKKRYITLSGRNEGVLSLSFSNDVVSVAIKSNCTQGCALYLVGQGKTCYIGKIGQDGCLDISLPASTLERAGINAENCGGCIAESYNGKFVILCSGMGGGVAIDENSIEWGAYGSENIRDAKEQSQQKSFGDIFGVSFNLEWKRYSTMNLQRDISIIYAIGSRYVWGAQKDGAVIIAVDYVMNSGPLPLIAFFRAASWLSQKGDINKGVFIIGIDTKKNQAFPVILRIN